MIAPGIQTTRPKIDLASAFLRLAAAALGATVVLVLLGWYPTVALAGADGPGALLAGVGVALVGGWFGIAVPVMCLHQPPRVLAWATLGGLGARFFVTLALALAASKLSSLPVKPLLLWVGLAQFVVLAVDMFGLIRIVRTLRPTEAA